MVDYLERLLELTEDERDEEEERDGLELRAAAAPAPGSVPEDGPEAGGTGEDPAREDVERGPAEEGPAGSAGLTVPPESRGEGPGGAGSEDGGGTGPEAGRPPAEGTLGDGPSAPAAGPRWKGWLRTAEGGEASPAGTAVAEAGDGPASSAGSAAPRRVERGLEGLYRQASQAVRPAAPALTAPQGGRTLRLGEPEQLRPLTVDELDRAVRRDSWRYDGGMDIF